MRVRRRILTVLLVLGLTACATRDGTAEPAAPQVPTKTDGAVIDVVGWVPNNLTEMTNSADIVVVAVASRVGPGFTAADEKPPMSYTPVTWRVIEVIGEWETPVDHPGAGRRGVPEPLVTWQMGQPGSPIEVIPQQGQTALLFLSRYERTSAPPSGVAAHPAVSVSIYEGVYPLDSASKIPRTSSVRKGICAEIGGLGIAEVKAKVKAARK